MSRQTPVRLLTERLIVRTLSPAEAGRVARFHADNVDHLSPWDPPRPRGYLTEAWWMERLAKDWSDLEGGRSCRLFMLPRGGVDANRVVMGQATLSNVVRGAMQGCTLGYSLSAAAEGHGYMTEALRDAVIPHAFRPRADGGLGLHRIQAGYVPENARSAAVLDRIGFERIGLARGYLHIGGAWRDHVLTQLLAPVSEGSPG